MVARKKKLQRTFIKKSKRGQRETYANVKSGSWVRWGDDRETEQGRTQTDRQTDRIETNDIIISQRREKKKKPKKQVKKNVKAGILFFPFRV